VKVELADKPGKVWLATAIGVLLVAYTAGWAGLAALPVITQAGAMKDRDLGRVTIRFAILLVIVFGVFSVLASLARPGGKARYLWPPAHGEPFDWDRYHARQDACLEKDRIAADCARGYCDELALRQAKRACSPFSDRKDGGRS
jgi:hypothetical protein